VVEIVTRPTGRRDKVRHLPVVEFETEAQGSVRFTSDFRGDPPFEVGAEVAVLYPPARPSQARLAALWPTWAAKVRDGFALAGGLLTAGALTLAVLAATKLRRARG
jgi:hypothetical protein